MFRLVVVLYRHLAASFFAVLNEGVTGHCILFVTHVSIKVGVKSHFWCVCVLYTHISVYACAHVNVHVCADVVLC